LAQGGHAIVIVQPLLRIVDSPVGTVLRRDWEGPASRSVPKSGR